ncbi:hypothetical protein ACFPRL_34260 [Pseudoclavibacter helvolus]
MGSLMRRRARLRSGSLRRPLVMCWPGLPSGGCVAGGASPARCG